ncbi:hypothetical protein [Methanobacterium sp.]|uniref:hypothetical protein n=1 Tax=Methanobacterium sp. TaxID=2164 RepID=UPI003C78F6B0
MTLDGSKLLNFGRILSLGPTGSFDESLIESGIVGYDPNYNKYRMVYAAYAKGTDGNPANGSVGLAWSEDLFHWRKDPLAPIFQKSGIAGTPDYGGITGPTIWFENNTYYLFYIGISADGYEAGTKTINMATAPDIYGPWTRHPNNPIIPPVADTWRKNHCFHPFVMKVDGTYYMFFNAGNPEQIGYATSTNLLDWVVDDVNSPVLLNDPDQSKWDGMFVGDPWIYKVDNKWYMSYYAYNGTTAHDGIATTTEEDFPLGWVKSPKNPILKYNMDGTTNRGAKPCIVQTENAHYHFYTSFDENGNYLALAYESIALNQGNRPDKGYNPNIIKGFNPNIGYMARKRAVTSSAQELLHVKQANPDEDFANYFAPWAGTLEVDTTGLRNDINGPNAEINTKLLHSSITGGKSYDLIVNCKTSRSQPVQVSVAYYQDESFKYGDTSLSKTIGTTQDTITMKLTPADIINNLYVALSCPNSQSGDVLWWISASLKEST